jgi:hypothetical protein
VPKIRELDQKFTTIRGENEGILQLEIALNDPARVQYSHPTGEIMAELDLLCD